MIAYYYDHADEIDHYLIEGEREFERLKRASREAHPEWYEKLERMRKEIPGFLEEQTCFQAGVNLNENIVTGILRRFPEIDFKGLVRLDSMALSILRF